LMQQPPRRQTLRSIEPVLDPGDLVGLQNEADRVHVSDPVTEYLLDLVARARSDTSPVSA